MFTRADIDAILAVAEAARCRAMRDKRRVRVVLVLLIASCFICGVAAVWLTPNGG